jgi:hypothetical protein
VKDLPRYTAAALRGDYRPKEKPYAANQPKRKQISKVHAQQAKQSQERLEALKREFERQRLLGEDEALLSALIGPNEFRLAKDMPLHRLFQLHFRSLAKIGQ